MPARRTPLADVERVLDDETATVGDIADAILHAIGADRVSVSALDGRAGAFEVVDARGEALLGPGTRFPVETSTHHEAAATGKTFVVDDFDHCNGFSRPVDHIVRAHGFRSGASLPLEHGNEPAGALNIHFNAPGGHARHATDLLLPLLDRLARILVAAEEVVATDVLVCHDDPLVANGIARLLEGAGHVTATIARTPTAALEAAATAVPDVVVADEAVGPGTPGTWVVDLRTAGVDAPVLVIAGAGSRESLDSAIAAGAAGYVLRTETERSLRLAVDAIARGETWLPPLPSATRAAGLTPRELDVLRGLDRGLRFAQIGVELGVSITTVKTHARSLFRKLGATSRAEATYEARLRGLLR